ncbi:MAG: rRNA pseudouridine synthase [Firmicutes bacterium]|nr:rRNA pseudouridine synthase [Bacillota bacterium]
MRLDRYLANMGCGSRSEVKRLIRSGKVTVNERPVKDESFQINPGIDLVICWGTEVVYRDYIYLMLNKPAGVISATEDSRERTVLDLIDPKYRRHGIFPVGRLDKDTEGLLVLTNDGQLAHQLLSPKKKVPKRYFAKVSGIIGAEDIEAFHNGIILDDGYRTMPAELKILQTGETNEVLVIIQEGKFHQIKRMFQALGKRVVYLKRLAMGELILDPNLKSGDYRELTEEEIEILSQAVKS